MTEPRPVIEDALFELPVLSFEVAHNPVWLWIVAAVGMVGIYAVLRVLVSQSGRRLRRISHRTHTAVDNYLAELVVGTRRLFLLVVAAAGVSTVLELSEGAADLRRWALAVALTVQAGLWGNRAISLWLARQRELRAATDPAAVTTFQGISYVVRLAIWSAAILLMLQNLGFDVSAIVAGLGIGGIAIALAVQNVLGDLFASLSIALDRPFVTGDFIIVDDKLGTVSSVGLKTTRVTSLSGEQLVFSNSDLLSSRIRNFKRMEERRVVFSFGVLYQTSIEQLEAIPPMVREIIEGTESTRFDRAHFKEFGASAYLFEVVYYVLAPDYNLYMDCQQRINLEICRGFEARGIGFAYPTRTLHVESVPEPPPLRRERSGSEAWTS